MMLLLDFKDADENASVVKKNNNYVLQLQTVPEWLLIMKNMWFWLLSPELNAETVDSWEAHGIKMTNHSSDTETEVNNNTPSPWPATCMLIKPSISKAFCKEIVIH